jgi:hypothetical protein
MNPILFFLRILNPSSIFIQPRDAPTWRNYANNNMALLAYHFYVKNNLSYVALSPTDYCTIDLLGQHIEQVKDWMCQNCLLLNTDKTEKIVFIAKDERQKETP